MADLASLIDAIGRIHGACRPRFTPDPGGGPPMSGQQARILACLDPEDPAMVGELAEQMGVTASTMSLTLKRMEEAGMVRRDRDPLDRRVTNVRLTPAGVRVRDARRELDPHRLDRILTLLPPFDRQEATTALATLAAAADRFLSREREAVEAQL